MVSFRDLFSADPKLVVAEVMEKISLGVYYATKLSKDPRRHFRKKMLGLAEDLEALRRRIAHGGAPAGVPPVTSVSFGRRL